VQRQLDPTATTTEGYNVLHIAAKYNCLPLLSFVLDETRLNVNALTGAYETPALLACAHGHLHAAEKILTDSRCNVRCEDSSGRGVLQVAIFGGHRAVVEFIINLGILDQAWMTSNAEGCYRDAIERCDYNILSLLAQHIPMTEAAMSLLNAAASIDPIMRVILFGLPTEVSQNSTHSPRSDITDTPREEPMLSGLKYTVVDAYDSPSITPRPQSYDVAAAVDIRVPAHAAPNGIYGGKSLLSAASWSGATPTETRSFGKNNVPPLTQPPGNKFVHSSGHTPREEVLRALSHEDYDETVSTTSNETAGSSLVAARLQMFGGGKVSAKVNSSDNGPSRKLSHCGKSSTSIVSTSSTCSTSSGVSIPSTVKLFALVEKGDVMELERLLGVTPNIKHDVRNVVDENGTYLIHHAVLFGHLDVVQYLVEGLGCDIHVADQHGRTALHVAVLQEHVLIVRYFTKYCGARFDAACKEGKTVSDIAESLKPSEKRDEICRTLQRAAMKSREKRTKISIPMY